MSTDRKFGEYAVAATAFFVSVCSLFIYIYQSKLMAEQQQVAVWPYVQWTYSNVDEYRFDAENKGVGPALVRKVALRYNGKLLGSSAELVKEVMGADSQLDSENGALAGTVMSAGEKRSFLLVPGKEGGKAFRDKFREEKMSLEITYCSIYGRCWTSVGLGSKRAPDDKNIDY